MSMCVHVAGTCAGELFEQMLRRPGGAYGEGKDDGKTLFSAGAVGFRSSWGITHIEGPMARGVKKI
jgi:hypothetical protein